MAFMIPQKIEKTEAARIIGGANDDPKYSVAGIISNQVFDFVYSK
jgi:hypothetical protein